MYQFILQLKFQLLLIGDLYLVRIQQVTFNNKFFIPKIEIKLLQLLYNSKK